MTQPAKPFAPRMRLNGGGLLAFHGHEDIRPYIGEVVQVLKQTKSGLYQIETNDGEFFSVKYENLTPLTDKERWREMLFEGKRISGYIVYSDGKCTPDGKLKLVFENYAGVKRYAICGEGSETYFEDTGEKVVVNNK